jgi:hypothetical protein
MASTAMGCGIFVFLTSRARCLGRLATFHRDASACFRTCGGVDAPGEELLVVVTTDEGSPKKGAT